MSDDPAVASMLMVADGSGSRSDIITLVVVVAGTKKQKKRLVSFALQHPFT